VTLPGTLITLAAAVSINGQPHARIDREIVVVSPAWVQAGRPTVYVCPRNEWHPLELGAQPAPVGWTVTKQTSRPLGVNAIIHCDPLANGWRVRTADGREGIQLTTGELFAEQDR